MKKIIAILSIFILSCNIIIFPHAQEEVLNETNSTIENKISYQTNESSVYLDAESKLSFAEEMDMRCEEALENGELQILSEDEKNELLMEFSFATGEEREQMRLELEKYGIYEFEPDVQSDSEIVPYSDSGDVTVNTPSVVYDSISKTWVVMCGGTWKTVIGWIH